MHAYHVFKHVCAQANQSSRHIQLVALNVMLLYFHVVNYEFLYACIHRAYNILVDPCMYCLAVTLAPIV